MSAVFIVVLRRRSSRAAADDELRGSAPGMTESRKRFRCARRCSIRFSLRCRRCPGSGRSWRSCSAACSGATASRRASSTCLFHLPTGFVDRRNQPKLSEVDARHGGDGRGHRRSAPAAAAEPAARALQYRRQRRHQHADHHLFQRAQGLSGKALARGRAALRVRHRDVLRRPFADGASRPRGRCGRVWRSCR